MRAAAGLLLPSMRHAKRNEPHGPAAAQKSPGTGAVSPLLQRLLEKVTGQRQEKERARGDAPPLPRAGNRSGAGSESVAPYLDEARSSRPAPLE